MREAAHTRTATSAQEYAKRIATYTARQYLSGVGILELSALTSTGAPLSQFGRLACAGLTVNEVRALAIEEGRRRFNI